MIIFVLSVVENQQGGLMETLDMVTTRGGDKGTAGLYDGRRFSKSSLYFECLGSIDELNTWLGVVKVHSQDEHDKECLTEIQGRLFNIGSLTATDKDSELFDKLRQLTDEDVNLIEKQEKSIMESIALKPAFVYPGKTELSGWTDVARAVCRRAERAMVRLREEFPLEHLATAQKYLNRLSDYLFILARKYDGVS